jgi:predicted deacetylase
VRRAGSIAVALHDVEPATFERCALIRDWLDDHGIARVTLLVIPAPDLHPFNDRRPEMVQWLADCAGRGDAIAQHGFQHRASAAAPRRSDPAAEFLGRAVEAGRLTLGTSSAVKRLASPWLVRAGALAAGDLLRLDLHPADLDHPRHIGALEGVLQRAHRRVRHAVTYDDLAL